MPVKRPVSLLKGQKTREESPSGSRVKPPASPNELHIGVSPHYIQTASSADRAEGAVWFLMRAAYGQERKAKEFLDALGIETFLPLHTQTYIHKGKKTRRRVSLIPNFLFVKSTEAEMKKYVGRGKLRFLHHYYIPHKDESGNSIGPKGITPLVIPERQMALFVRWNTVDDDGKLFVAGDRFNFTKDDRVKIIKGKFAGFEGRICRIKGQTRVGMIIEGIGTIFTAYIPKDCLEKCSSY